MSEVFHSVLPRDPSCGSAARRLLETHLSQHLDDALDDAKMVVSELVNNAYVHGEGRIDLRVFAGETQVRIEVIDEGHNSRLVANHLARGGSRGLGLVGRITDRWGTRGKTITHVWAELPIALATPAPPQPDTRWLASG